MRRFEYFANRGLTNSNSDDYGTFASSKTDTRREYVHWCTSDKCCHYIAGHRTLKNNEVVPINKYKMKVHKFTKYVRVPDCPECGSALVIK